MTWNYRVVRSKEGLRIFDVYYDDAGHAIATHVQPTYVYGETVEEMKEQLELMLGALAKTILEEDEIGASTNLGKKTISIEQ